MKTGQGGNSEVGRRPEKRRTQRKNFGAADIIREFSTRQGSPQRKIVNGESSGHEKLSSSERKGGATQDLKLK